MNAVDTDNTRCRVAILDVATLNLVEAGARNIRVALGHAAR